LLVLCGRQAGVLSSLISYDQAGSIPAHRYLCYPLWKHI